MTVLLKVGGIRGMRIEDKNEIYTIQYRTENAG
jgi:hypothetical protein